MNLFKKSIYPIFLSLISCVLFFTNYKPATFLIGWDNLLPEFNIGLDIQRNLTGVWQDYRGLGLIDGQSHIANLIHSFFIFGLTFVLPQASIRFFVNIFLHFLGGLGMYYLAKKYHTKNLAFLSALFYMFNIGTIQQFFAPFEGFSFQFAFLPWLFLTGINFIEQRSKKSLLVFFITSILSTPQAFVPTTFITTTLTLFSLIFMTKNKKSFLKLLTVFFIANSFWLLPYLYSIPYNSPNILNSHINQFSSEEMFLYNKVHGDLNNVLSLKGFMIDSIEYDTNKKSNVYFMDAWRNHVSSIPYKTISIIFIGITFLGIISVLKSKNKTQYPFLFILLTSGFFRATNTPILEQINTALRSAFPIFAESFRFPFTKFIITFVFSFSFLFLEGILALVKQNTLKQKVLLLCILASIIFIAYPAFLGNFFSPLLKVHVPKEYKLLFSYFNSIDENKRIALLPAHTFWPWHYRTWGQRGSGFLWFGLKQPILERAFDQWSKYNEQFYNEFSYALNTKDQALLNTVLQKYDVSYLLVDGYLQDILLKPSIDYSTLRNFLDTNPHVSKQKEFGKILIYKKNTSTSPVYSLEAKTLKVNPLFSFKREDSLSPQNYIEASRYNVSYLFSSLASVNSQDNLDFEVTQNTKSLTFAPRTKTGNVTKNQLLEIPSLFESEFLLPVSVKITDGKLVLTPTLGTIYINNQSILIREDPLILEPDFIFQPEKIVFKDTHQEVDGKSQSFVYLLNNKTNSITLEDKNGRKETLTIDTTEIKRQPILLALPDSLKTIQIRVEKIKSNLTSVDIVKNKAYVLQKNKSELNSYKSKDSYARITPQGNTLVFEAKSDNNQLMFYNNNLFHQGTYILLAKTKYISGIPLSFYFDNYPSVGSDLEIRFPKNTPVATIVIPKSQEYGQGYAFHFIIKSMGTEIAKSTIDSFDLFPFPQKTLVHMRFVNASYNQNHVQSNKMPVKFNKQNLFTYTLPGCCKPSYIVLSQAYDEGWKAYQITNKSFVMLNSLQHLFPFLFGSEIKEHVTVNGWSNGWFIGNWKLEIGNSQVVLVYLPQYLEYIGFALIIFTATVLWKFGDWSSNGLPKAAQNRLSG